MSDIPPGYHGLWFFFLIFWVAGDFVWLGNSLWVHDWEGIVASVVFLPVLFSCLGYAYAELP